jgi:site-specific DNA-methyltransferase (adenine-specific)
MIERENKHQEQIQQGMEYTACCTLADCSHEPTNEAQKIKNAKRGEINFYLCDNIEFMKTKPDKYYDLAIVDPPYGINVAKMAYTQEDNRPCKQKNGSTLHVKKKKYKHGDWDKESAGIEWLTELQRVSKHQIIFGINYMDFQLKGGRLIWNKLVPEGVSFSDCEIAYCSMFERVENVFFRWAGMIQGVYCGKDVMKAIIQQGNKQLNEERIHPTQKPVMLYRYILQKYATKGMKIIDTNGGSMSLAIACDMEGFELDICEIDNEYFDNGLQRFDMYKRQLKLF